MDYACLRRRGCALKGVLSFGREKGGEHGSSYPELPAWGYGIGIPGQKTEAAEQFAAKLGAIGGRIGAQNSATTSR